jgi:hypothetical protein
MEKADFVINNLGNRDASRAAVAEAVERTHYDDKAVALEDHVHLRYGTQSSTTGTPPMTAAWREHTSTEPSSLRLGSDLHAQFVSLADIPHVCCAKML